MNSENVFIKDNNCHFADGRQVPALCELAARCVASHIPFELVEHFYSPVPEQLQLRIAFWSFPDNEEDIRLYSCLANGSADEFNRGEQLFRQKNVQDPLQIGWLFLSRFSEGIFFFFRPSSLPSRLFYIEKLSKALTMAWIEWGYNHCRIFPAKRNIASVYIYKLFGNSFSWRKYRSTFPICQLFKTFLKQRAEISITHFLEIQAIAPSKNAV